MKNISLFNRIGDGFRDSRAIGRMILTVMLTLSLAGGLVMTSGIGFAEVKAAEAEEQTAVEATTEAAKDSAEKKDLDQTEDKKSDLNETEDKKEAQKEDQDKTEDKKSDQDQNEDKKSDQDKAKDVKEKEDDTDVDADADADADADMDEEDLDDDSEKNTAEKEVVKSKGDEADLTADLESVSDWESTLPKKLAHDKDLPTEKDYRSDIVAIAKSQVGYKESKKNFIEYDDGSRAHYNRYGAWYADSYAAPWDAEFACFVLYYAGVPDVAYDSDTGSWTSELSDDGMYFGTDYQAKEGDLVFLEEKDETFHVGIITEAGKKNLTVAAATVGEKRNEVEEFKISRNSNRIFAYGVVVPQDEAVVEDSEATDQTSSQAEQADQAEAEENKVEITKDTVEAVVYTDESQKTILSEVSISVSGDLPEGAKITAYPVQVSVKGEETYAAYQIIILDKNGQRYHSKANDGKAITVTINDAALTKALESAKDAHGWHKDADDVSALTFNLLGDGGVQFVADVF